MFLALGVGNVHKLQQLGLKFAQQGNEAAALLCLDNVYNTPPPIGEAETIQQGIAMLESFLVYVQLLYDAAHIKDPSRSRAAQWLFAFTECGDDRFGIFPRTFLAGINKHHLLMKGDMGTLSSQNLSQTLKGGLTERLKARVMEVHQLCRKARIFSPCLNILLGTCRNIDCWRGHFGSATLESCWYNDRVRMCLLQIQIFQQLHFVNMGSDRGKEKM